MPYMQVLLPTFGAVTRPIVARYFYYTNRLELELKGKSDPIPVFGKGQVSRTISWNDFMTGYKYYNNVSDRQLLIVGHGATVIIDGKPEFFSLERLYAPVYRPIYLTFVGKKEHRLSLSSSRKYNLIHSVLNPMPGAPGSETFSNVTKIKGETFINVPNHYLSEDYVPKFETPEVAEWYRRESGDTWIEWSSDDTLGATSKIVKDVCEAASEIIKKEWHQNDPSRLPIEPQTTSLENPLYVNMPITTDIIFIQTGTTKLDYLFSWLKHWNINYSRYTVLCCRGRSDLASERRPRFTLSQGALEDRAAEDPIFLQQLDTRRQGLCKVVTDINLEIADLLCKLDEPAINPAERNAIQSSLRELEKTKIQYEGQLQRMRADPANYPVSSQNVSLLCERCLAPFEQHKVISIIINYCKQIRFMRKRLNGLNTKIFGNLRNNSERLRLNREINKLLMQIKCYPKKIQPIYEDLCPDCFLPRLRREHND